MINLYCEFMQGMMSRREFLDRMSKFAGGIAAAMAILPMLQSNDAEAQSIADDDRLEVSQAEYDARMAMPGPEFVAPMVGYLLTDEAGDINGQLFHAEKGRLHTYYFGEEARSIYKNTNNGLFTVDELKEVIPASLMAGIPNVAPRQEG